MPRHLDGGIRRRFIRRWTHLTGFDRAKGMLDRLAPPPHCIGSESSLNCKSARV